MTLANAKAAKKVKRVGWFSVGGGTSMFTLMPKRAQNEIARKEPFDWFRQEFAPLFNRAFPAWPTPFEFPYQTRYGLEMEETEKEYLVFAEVPGFEPSELEVQLAGNVLTIRAEHKKSLKGTAPVEYPYGRLEKTFTLPVGINPDKVEAFYRNGILELHFAKTPEAQTRHIEIKV
jgi:HSP20 family protein